VATELPDADPRFGFIARTGQWWKIHVVRTALLIGCIVLVGSWRWVEEGLLRRILMNIGIGMAVLTWAWLSLATRCPRCRYRILFHAYESFSVQHWYRRALAMRTCPKCGYRPE
jgi:hypothetical protein